MTRLHYETSGGNVSEADTFAKLIEYLRLAQESCYVLGHLAKANDDDIKGDGWLRVGEGLKRMQAAITVLATGRTIIQ